jgi:hypothetical protein
MAIVQGDLVISRREDGTRRDQFQRQVVNCSECGDWTPMVGTELCDRCWELKTRIEQDPELAPKILNRVISGKGN